jgi:alkylation response protein AidB-like acyl-CoA dehydrogenase
MEIAGIPEIAEVDDVTASSLLARARELIEPLRSRAAETEQLRYVPRENVDAIIAAELMRIATPKKFGGLSVPYSTMLEAAVILGSACGSTGWCYALWAVDSWMAGLFPLEAQEEIFSSGPDVLISGTYNPMAGRLTKVAGGYRFNGRWEFASGCHWCEWIFLGCRGPDDDIMWAALPRGDFEIVDTWHVLGLRGTSSSDIVVNDLFVPEHRTLRVSEVAAGGPDSRAWQIHHQARYWLPFRSILVWDLVAPGIGIARAAVDEYASRFSQKRGAGRTAESGSVQLRLIESSAEVDAVHALMRQDLAEMFEGAQAGETLRPLDIARYERDKAYVATTCLRAVHRLYDVAGGHAIFNPDPLQRMYRDATAVAHRDRLVLDFGGDNFARLSLGLEPVPRPY